MPAASGPGRAALPAWLLARLMSPRGSRVWRALEAAERGLLNSFCSTHRPKPDAWGTRVGLGYRGRTPLLPASSRRTPTTAPEHQGREGSSPLREGTGPGAPSHSSAFPRDTAGGRPALQEGRGPAFCPARASGLQARRLRPLFRRSCQSEGAEGPRTPLHCTSREQPRGWGWLLPQRVCTWGKSGPEGGTGWQDSSQRPPAKSQ